mgnify:FL=1
MTPEEELYNDHEQDANRFKNFAKVVLYVIGIILGMIAVNIYY